MTAVIFSLRAERPFVLARITSAPTRLGKCLADCVVVHREQDEFRAAEFLLDDCADLHSTQAWHDHVEDQQVGFQLESEFESLFAIRSRRADFHVGEFLEKGLDDPAHGGDCHLRAERGCEL
jgi:hypothetical protein